MRPVRRKDRAIDIDEAVALLTQGEYGVLSTVDGDGQPYGVPLNYVYKNDAIYFHCARVGHKIENVESNPRVSFCVVGDTRILPDKFSTIYESAVVFGTASETKGSETDNALIWLLEKYSPEFVEEGRKCIKAPDNGTKVIKIEIVHVSGKARR